MITTPTDSWETNYSLKEIKEVRDGIMKKLPNKFGYSHSSEVWKRTRLALDKLNIFELNFLWYLIS